ncbi:MAG: hypothetical protein A2X84_04815 [Desulfuromonadaceae bacterium GWC2_58_13]|nr:MAG: hypothetical protein A2X84_04815 [Desulfuromonadaceae bacterium GWC2_58_13]
MTAESRPELEAFIHRRIDEAEGISFAEYMGHCLYHPDYGYYIAPRERIGKGGDFFTSTSVHSAFGRLICRQLEQMWQLLGKGDFTIAEQGAGEGHLCLDILAAAAEDHPEFYQSLSYCLVEISPDNRQRQANLLGAHHDRVRWSTLPELDGMEGCFLTNELVDAFPVHLVEMKDGRLQEVFVIDRDGGFGEELRPLSTLSIQEYFNGLGITLAEGSRAEINLEAPRWMAEVGSLLRRGFVITVDYGYPAAELYAPWRNRGTLMCYCRHTSSEDPYRMAGCQDITAHIDFTALEQAGGKQGLEPLFFGAQYRFLMGLGFVEVLLEMQARTTDENQARALRMTLKNLIMPDGGMGETFKVLVQGKGVGSVSLLCQRSIREIPLPMAGMF